MADENFVFLKDIVKSQGQSVHTVNKTGFSGNINNDLISEVTSLLGTDNIFSTILNGYGPPTYNYTNDEINGNTYDVYIAIPLIESSQLGTITKIEFDWEQVNPSGGSSGAYAYGIVGLYKVNSLGNGIESISSTSPRGTGTYPLTFSYSGNDVLYLCITTYETDYVISNVKIYCDYVPITYTWQSVPSISGKNGILSLTHVRNDSLLDGGSQTFTPEQVYVSEQTRVGHLMENVPIGKAIKAIFSGVNFLGIYKDTSTTNTVRMVLTEHIQREIFQSSFITDKCYIGFIMDVEQTAGRIGIFFPQYDPLTEILTGYHVDFTDTDYSETDVYNWLQGGIDADTPEINQPNEGTPEDYQPDIPITGIVKPSYGAIETGFTTMFRCSKGELQRLSAFLWSASFVDNVKKFFNDPREIIVGLSIMPVLPDTDREPAEIKAGGISTGVYGLKLTDQYKLDTYGVIEVKATKGNFLDYAPYTSVTAHLPFVGEHTLDVNDVMGKQLVLKYIFDFLTGSCVAEIDVYDDGEFKPRYFFGGSCGIQVPTSSEDFGKMYSSILSAGATVGSTLATIATGGLTAPLMIGAASSMLANGMNGSPTVQYSSGSGSINGMIGCKSAFLVISRPKEKIADNQAHYIGRPSFMTKKLNSCSGYVKCLSVHLDNIAATEGEREEIEAALLNGVIIASGSETPSYTPTSDTDNGLIFLKCKSDKNVIGKTWNSGTGDINTIEGKILFNKSLLNPTFLIEGDVSDYNYCYIPLFKRFYYIMGITAKSGNMEEVEMKVDVLQSWKGDSSEGILSNDAVIEREENDINVYFSDNMFWTQADKEVITVPFLDRDGNDLVFDIPENNFILTIAGGD